MNDLKEIAAIEQVLIFLWNGEPNWLLVRDYICGAELFLYKTGSVCVEAKELLHSAHRQASARYDHER